MKVVWVTALLALLALCEGLAMTKEGPLKKHDRKKDGLTSSSQLKEDKKEASILRLTGQPLVPKKDVAVDSKDEEVVTKNKTKIGVTKEASVSEKVRQQVRKSQEGAGNETAAAPQGKEEAAAPKLAAVNPESKLVSVGNTQITVGSPTDLFNGINLSDVTFGSLGTLFQLGTTSFTGLFSSLPTFTIGGIGSGDLLSALSGIGIGGGGNAIFAGLLGIGAAIAAGLAALFALIVPGLQIANQVLAIIAISLLGAYLAEDKGGEDYYDTGYDSGTGYDDSGTGYSLSSSGIGSGGGYGSSPGVVGSGIGYSSYSDYRRSALDQAPFDGFTNLFGPQQPLAVNTLDGADLDSIFAGVQTLSAGKPVITGRSMASDGLVNGVGRMVSDAVKKYSDLYAKEGESVGNSDR